MLQVNFLFIIIFCSFLLSCDGNGEILQQTDLDVGECSIPQQNRFVHELLLDQYLWYEEIPETLELAYSEYDSPQQLLDLLKVEQDRFSNISDAEAFNDLFGNGQTIKYGFSFIVEADDTVTIRFVYDDSAAGRADLERGDKIKSINGQSVEDIIASIGWDEIFGPDIVGYPLDMVIQKRSGDVTSLHLEKSLISINTVLHHSIIDQGEDRVAYLVFNSFLRTSSSELFAVFSDFKAAGVNKMILDLRYNGGGLVSVAQDLASAMLSPNSPDDLFTELKHNDKHPELNESYHFLTLQNELELDQVSVITTGATASASELVINGLQPFVDIKTVGSKTFGKPVGMNPFQFCDKVILPITFASFNENGAGGYFDGIPVDCAAEDDTGYAFGDINEPMLAEALFVSQNNVCSSLSKAEKRSEKNHSAPTYSLQDIIGVY